MPRKRLTQIFPFLLPLRKWQRKKFFYLKMRLDHNQYAKKRLEYLFPHTVFEASSLMLNENSGFDMKYQVNKVHNLKLAAKTVNQVVITPGETFSFWQLVRWADRYEKYKDGLNFVDGKIVGSYGGGLCQLSNLLFWLFLHTPLRIVERHGHSVLSIPATEDDLPCGIDATVNEGWLDLKLRNDSGNTFQVEINFDDRYMYGRILSQTPIEREYKVFNPSVSYVRENGQVFQVAPVYRQECSVWNGERIEAGGLAEGGFADGKGGAVSGQFEGPLEEWAEDGRRSQRLEAARAEEAAGKNEDVRIEGQAEVESESGHAIELYINRCAIGYKLPDDIVIEESGAVREG